MDCPFCLAVNASEHVIAKTAHCYFIQSNDPVLRCSGLIIPCRHVSSPFDLTEQEWLESLRLLQNAKSFFEQFEPAGFNLGWNVGEVAGQDIMHAHLHIIGRFSDEPLAGRGIRYHLKQPENTRR